MVHRDHREQGRDDPAQQRADETAIGSVDVGPFSLYTAGAVQDGELAVPCRPESAYRGPCQARGTRVFETVPAKGVESCKPCNGKSWNLPGPEGSNSTGWNMCRGPMRLELEVADYAEGSRDKCLAYGFPGYVRRRAVTTQSAAIPSPLPIHPTVSLPVTLTSTSATRSPSSAANLCCMGP
jgi:hypothetical protein